MVTFPEPLSLFVLLCVAIAGRVLLAALPPGEPGGMRPHEWPATYAASLLFGGAVLRAAFGLGSIAVVFAGVLLVAIAVSRFFARPTAMRPRHEPAREPSTLPARAAWCVSWLVVIGVFAVRCAREADPGRGRDWIAFGMILALAVLVDWALRVSRCRHWVRAAALAALAAIVLVAPARLTHLDAAVYFGAGSAATIAWFRRADRRAMTLAAAFFATTILTSREGWVLALAGTLVLIVGTARASRRRALLTCGIAITLSGAARLEHLGHFEPAAAAEFSSALYGIIGILFAAVLIARWWDLRGVRLPAWNPSGASVGHERAMLLRTLLFALIFAWLARALRLDMRADFALLPALFVLVILFGSSLERLCDRG